MELPDLEAAELGEPLPLDTAWAWAVAAIRWALILISAALLFFGAFLGAGASMHAARGPHVHGCNSARETCTDGP